MAEMMLLSSDSKNGIRKETRWEKLYPDSLLLSSLIIKAYLNLLLCV